MRGRDWVCGGDLGGTNPVRKNTCAEHFRINYKSKWYYQYDQEGKDGTYCAQGVNNKASQARSLTF